MEMKELAQKVENYYCDNDSRGKKYIEKALVALSRSGNCEAVLRARTEHAEILEKDEFSVI